MPSVSVFIVGSEPEGIAAAVESVRMQSFDDWRAVVIAPAGIESPIEHSSRRFSSRECEETWHDALNEELASARTDYVLILPAGSRLRTDALASLVAEASASGADAVYGQFRFAALLGEIPMASAERAGVLGARQWERCKAAPLGAQLFCRESIAGEAFDASCEDAADWDWCLRLARKGVCWRRCEDVVVDVALRPLVPATEMIESLRAHARVGAAVAVGAAGVEEQSDDARPIFAEAERRVEALVEFQRSKNAWMHAGMETPWRFSQWWHRFGYVGGAPEHLLTNKAPTSPRELVELDRKPPIDIFVATYKRPDRLAPMIESVRATGYPARVYVAAGDIESVRVCEKYPEFVECVYSTAANRLTGCTAPLNHVISTLVRNDAIFCTDDCVFAPDSLDVAARSLYTAFPDSDGVVGLAQENIPNGYPLAFPLVGKRFRERFTSRGPLFFPGYFHMYNDGELGMTIECLGNWHFEPRAKLRHFHPCTGVAEDATHTRGRTFGRRDAHVWHERRMKGLVWGVDE